MGLFDFFKKQVEEDTVNMPSNDSYERMGQTVSGGEFLMEVEDVFTITGRGTIVTGRIERGSVDVGDNIILTSKGGNADKMVTVTGIEQFRKTLMHAVAGENVGILLNGITRADVAKGDVLHK